MQTNQEIIRQVERHTQEIISKAMACGSWDPASQFYKDKQNHEIARAALISELESRGVRVTCANEFSVFSGAQMVEVRHVQ